MPHVSEPSEQLAGIAILLVSKMCKVGNGNENKQGTTNDKTNSRIATNTSTVSTKKNNHAFHGFSFEKTIEFSYYGNK